MLLVLSIVSLLRQREKRERERERETLTEQLSVTEVKVSCLLPFMCHLDPKHYITLLCNAKLHWKNVHFRTPCVRWRIRATAKIINTVQGEGRNIQRKKTGKYSIKYQYKLKWLNYNTWIFFVIHLREKKIFWGD